MTLHVPLIPLHPADPVDLDTFDAAEAEQNRDGDFFVGLRNALLVEGVAALGILMLWAWWLS